MERFDCSMCHQLVDGGLDGLVGHLTGIHGLIMTRGMGKHIKKDHLTERNNEFQEAPEHVVYNPYNESIDDVKMADDDAEHLNENPDVDCDVDSDFRTFIIGMIARFQCQGSMTGRTLTQLIDECEELLLQTCNFLKARVKIVLQEKGVLNDLGLEDVLQVFEFESPFRGLKTFDQQIEDLKDDCGYIEPIEMEAVVSEEQNESIDGTAFLELTNDDSTQVKIEMGPGECILKIVEETKEKENVVLGNYMVEGNGTLQRLDLDIPTTASTANEQCSQSDESSVPHRSIAQPGPSQSSTESKPSVDTYSRYGTVEEVLVNHPQGKSVLEAARTAFTEESRRVLIRIVVAELVKVHDSHYPPEQAKIALAMAIVREFPLLKDEKSTKGYEHYYDSFSKRGFIEYRLWTMRKNLSPTKKKYNASERKKNSTKSKNALFSTNQLKQLPKKELDEKISWMKCKNPTDSNKTAIITCLKETFANRRNWISEESPTISQVFEKYPRLLDYNGEMIDLEFENMYGGATNHFLARFPSYYSPRILAYSSSHRPDLYKLTSNIHNTHLRALVILVQLLPVTNAQKKRKGVYQASAGKKGKKKRPSTEPEIDDPNEDEFDGAATLATPAEIPNGFLIQTVQEGENLPQLVQKVRQESGGNVQPFLIRVCGQRDETFIVQGDGWFITVHDDDDPIIAFDLLFKCYCVLNVSYPVSLQNFYNFMECYIYKIESQTQSIVSSVHVNIANTKLNTGKNLRVRKDIIDDKIEIS